MEENNNPIQYALDQTYLHRNVYVEDSRGNSYEGMVSQIVYNTEDKEIYVMLDQVYKWILVKTITCYTD